MYATLRDIKSTPLVVENEVNLHTRTDWKMLEQRWKEFSRDVMDVSFSHY